MPEFPDLELYLHALRPRVQGQRIEAVRVLGPALLRTAEPRLWAVVGQRVEGVRRLGKRIVFATEDELFLALHLMIAGRFQWKPPGSKLPRRGGQAAFEFKNGSLQLIESGSRKRASLHLLRGEAALAELDAGGIDPVSCSASEFTEVLQRENHTLKRALTDPRLFSGIGNAYSDEILHRARLSPFQTSSALEAATARRLHTAIQAVLLEWRDRLIAEAGEEFPRKVTAFRPEMAVHGKYGDPCPVCGAPVQRVIYATKNEMNYCPGCQTEGRVLADRSLSRLLRDEWPRNLEDLEELRGKAREQIPGKASP